VKRPLALLVVLSSIVAVAFVVFGGQGSQAGGARAAPEDLAEPAIVISEVAWSGTACDAIDEWIELHNNTASPIDLEGWTLRSSDNSPNLTLQGIIPADGFFLLERQDDDTVSDIPADLVYSGALNNYGETLQLLDDSAAVVDTANADGGIWPGGLVDPRHSMERIDPALPDSDANWGTNDGLTRNGLDCNEAPINGTPKAPNSTWDSPGADLKVEKRGPETVLPGERITYTLALSNAGRLPAETVRLTDVLPAQVQFLTHTALYPFHQPAAGTLVWEVGAVPTTTASDPITFTLTGRVEAAAGDELVNAITATTTTPEGHPADNHDVVVTLVGDEPPTSLVLIEGLYYDGHADYDYDEAFRLRNLSSQPVDLTGWSVTDRADRAGADFPPGTSLAPGQGIWCTRKAIAFAEQYGFKADFETDETDPDVPEMGGSWPTFANDGGACLLRDAKGALVDALVYTGGDTTIPGWQGPSVKPWSPNNYFGAKGQILYRKRDQLTGLPLYDTDSAADWAQDPTDQVYGRKVQYPGWDLDAFFQTTRITETAVLTVAVGPDHLLETVLTHIEHAQESIRIQGYTFESAALAQALLERLAAGVEVTLLLEGTPAGGMEPAQRWICNQIRYAGGQVYFMYENLVPPRYRFQHAKIILIDDRLALIGSENLNPSGMPADDKSDGTAGRRGVYLITDAPGVVDHIQALLAVDIDPPPNHFDLVTCDDLPALCSGTPPLAEPNWTSYTVAFSEPLTVQGEFAFEVIQSPENSLRTVDSLLGLVGQAGSGDMILVEQLYEYLLWGPGDGAPPGGDPETDPNLRLEAYIEAARRGATVRILLNSFTFADYENENLATVAYLRSTARAEGLDLQARLGNPTYLGVHNKMVLARIDGRGYVHVGSINGSEVSSKVNREVALQVQSDEAYQYLQDVFHYDWLHSPLLTFLPLVIKKHETPRPAQHLLISEILPKVGAEQEWVEILNPTDVVVDLTAYKIGDAEEPDTFEGMYQFPPGTRLGPRQILVIASSATAFRQNYGQPPDYEFYETDPAVPNLTHAPSWGEGEWELRNDGDEVLLLDGLNRPVDVVVYGDNTYPGVIPHPGVSFYTHSLERYPPRLDTDDCSRDFRDWAFPNPGELSPVVPWEAQP
jgi:uncharacterized repeat protein (TIGR01451 family)